MRPGAQLGPYRVETLLGEGGMGQVYLATDTRLDRHVAIKVVTRELAADRTLRERFEREAKVISRLGHPNICALYDIGHESGVDFLVMEYLQGETLAQRIGRGPLPVQQVIRIGVEIANALAVAHRQGIVHRDLKPGNVMLTATGVKLLDFGLAKTEASGLGPRASVVETERMPLTQEGTIVGTFQYMAPEQVEGKTVDARSDVFALGCILYEMATGRRAFDAPSRAGVIAAILEREPPPMRSVEPVTPPSLERLVRACLAKDPEERMQTARDVALELRWIGEAPAPEADAAAQSPRSRTVPWTVAALVAIAAIAMTVFYFRARPQPKPFALSIVPPPGQELVDGGSVSPDGTSVAFATLGADGRQTLWLRRLDDPAPKPLATMNPFPLASIFWSPDGKWIGYTDYPSSLMRVRPGGGEPEKIEGGAAGHGAIGGTWSRRGVIVFAPRFGTGLSRVSVAGGESAAVTTLDSRRRELAHLTPFFLPDGDHFLYLAYTSSAERNQIWCGSLDSGRETFVVSADALVGYSPPYLLFAREGAVYAQRFDADRAAVGGEPSRVVENITYREPDALALAWVSPNGVLAYLPYQASPVRLNVYDRSGSLLRTLWNDADVWRDFDLADVRLSRSGRMLLVNETNRTKGAPDPVVVDLARGVPTRMTRGLSSNRSSVWSPDEQSIAFSSDRNGFYDVYVKSADPAAPERPVWQSREDKQVADWSPDGRNLLVVVGDPSARRIWVVPVAGSAKPWPLLQAGGTAGQPQFSPDGKWVAYASNESGESEVYVRGLPSGRTVRISTAGGRTPTWSGGGTELLFSTASGDVMLATIRENGSAIEPGVPKKLFSIPDVAQAPRLMPDGNILVGEAEARATQVLDVTTAWRSKAP